MLGSSWRRYEDPAVSRDPRVRAVVGALASLPSPEPRPEFRAELRAQLVAITPRIISETVEADTPLVDIVPGKTPARATSARSARAKHADGALASVRSISIGRPLAVAVSVLTAFALLFGGAVWMSQKALPGDTLYGLKRASESWRLATDGNPSDKARDYLHFAQTRVDEARDLAQRATATAAGPGVHAGGFDAHTADLVGSTLASADHDVTSASWLLGTQAVKSKSTSPLGAIPSWAPAQLQRLRELASLMPQGALRARTMSSIRLVNAAVQRANQLAATMRTGCLSTSNSDALGPVPYSNCPSHPAGAPKPSGHPKTGNKPSKANHHGPSVGTSAAPPRASTSPSNGPSSPPSTSPSQIITVPPLPLPTSSLPLRVNSCSLGLSLGIVTLGIGVCPSG
jgi:hypothetical protein